MNYAYTKPLANIPYIIEFIKEFNAIQYNSSCKIMNINLFWGFTTLHTK